MIENQVKICYYIFMDNVNDKFYKIFESKLSEFEELEEIVSTIEVMSDHKLYSHYIKKMKELEPFAFGFKRIKEIDFELDEFENLADDSSFLVEAQAMKKEKEHLLNELKRKLACSRSLKDEKVLIEISSKTTTDFVSEIGDVFIKYLNDLGVDIIENKNSGETLTILCKGENVYKNLKIFSGKIKKVLRGNESFASVVVLLQDEEDLVISEDDLIIQTSKSGGAGGQHINKTESAVKIIHVPTGIFAECQDERSQLKNKEKAMTALIQKITQKTKEKNEKLIKKQRDELKNKIFASTPSFIFDYDLNEVLCVSDKLKYRLKDIIQGDLSLIINNQVN